MQGGIARIVVLRAGCSYRQRLETLLARRGIAVPRLMEFGTLEAIFGCVSAGLGITLLPRALIGPVWRAGRVSLHRLPPEEAIVTTVFIHRREAHLSSASRAFLAHVRAGAAPDEAIVAGEAIVASEAIVAGDSIDLIKPLPRTAPVAAN
jgi:DNA-binding transcriptional LysR family regulator